MRPSRGPDPPGTYAVILRYAGGKPVMVGGLGELALAPGCYVYTGSAFGSGGVRARVGHHLRGAARCHWHIDYLRRRARPLEVWYSYDGECREHDWAGVFRHAWPGAQPVAGFGASDCRCGSHLFFVGARPSQARFRRLLFARVAGHAKIHAWAAANGGRAARAPKPRP